MWKITLSDLVLHQDDHRAVADALESGWLTMGPRTAAFERAFAVALDPDDPPLALAVTNCTAALHLALLALDIGPGDEVIVPDLTFVATANAVLYTGATVVLVDVTSADDLTISVAAVAAAITERTRAVIPVHYAGQPADLGALERLCAGHGVHLIEDNAHGPLADGRDAAGRVRALGTVGAIGCFSFFSNKNMATGEGGMLVSRDAALIERLRLLRSHGMTALTMERHRGHAHGYDVVALGHNHRIDEIRAALGTSQLSRLPANNRLRAEVVARYAEHLAAIDALVVPFAGRPMPGRSAPHIQVVLLPDGVDRGIVQASMRDAGIQTSVHYPPIHSFSYHSDCDRVRIGPLPVVEAVAARLITLPLYPTLTRADVALVVDTLAAAIGHAREVPAAATPEATP